MHNLKAAAQSLVLPTLDGLRWEWQNSLCLDSVTVKARFHCGLVEIQEPALQAEALDHLSPPGPLASGQVVRDQARYHRVRLSSARLLRCLPTRGACFRFHWWGDSGCSPL